PLKWTSFFHDLCFLLDSVFFGNGIESFLDLVFCQSVLFDMKVIRAYTAFVTAATHIFIFVFFGAENLLVTVLLVKVDVAFTCLSDKIVSADNDVFFPNDRHRNPYLKDVALPIPHCTLQVRVFPVSDDASF